MDYLSHYDSPLGPITLSSEGKTLTGLWFDGQKYFGATLSKEQAEKALPIFDEARRWLDAYFQGADPGPTPPLDPGGTPFQRAVWDILCTIPRGSTLTYGEIGGRVAQAMGRASMSAQAVGHAVGRNPISILIPCHRVIGAGGSLTGYAGGVDRKLRLLKLEGMDAARFTLPK